MPQQRMSTVVSPKEATALFTAWQQLDGVVAAATDALAGDVIVWEARGGRELSAADIGHLTERVRLGASLLLTLAQGTGNTPPHLGHMLPTTAWGTRTGYQTWAPSGEAVSESWDKEMFAGDEAKGMVLPYHFDIAPLAAVERGQGRYENLVWTANPFAIDGKSGPEFWSRPLLNRDWKVRVSAANVSGSPMLVTGRYGAGKVAVLGASAGCLDGWDGAGPWWTAVLRWLMPQEISGVADEGNVGTAQVGIGSYATGNRRIRMTIRNQGLKPLRGLPVLRLSTWEGALIGDLASDQKMVTVGSQETVELDFALAATGDTNYQALDIADAYRVRCALLSASGAKVIAEHDAFVDFRSPISLSIQCDNLYAMPAAAHGPHEDEPGALKFRMGSRVAAYAYGPGQTVHAEALVSHGLRNLASFAVVRDEVDPANASVFSLNDGAIVGRKTASDGIQAVSMWTGVAGKENILSFTFPRAISIGALTLVGHPATMPNEFRHNPGAIVVELDGKQVAKQPDADKLFQADHGRATITLKPMEATRVVIRLPWVPMAADRKREIPWLGEVEVLGWVGAACPAVSGTLKIGSENSLSGERTSLLEREISLLYGTSMSIPVEFTVPAGGARGPEFYRLTAAFGSGATSSATLASAPILLVAKESECLGSLEDAFSPNAAAMGYIVTRGFRNVFLTGTGTQELYGSWEEPDDLIWAYSRQLKQLGKNARTQAGRLYVTESDMRHYSTPWRSFPNGALFYDVATPCIVDNMKRLPKWNKSDVAILNHSDRWDTGPDVGALHGWQDFIDFDEHLRASGGSGLSGKTRQEIADDIHAHHEAAWQSWHLDRYSYSVSMLRTAFQKEGKRLIISAQGQPMVATDAATSLSETVLGMSDDSTWGMLNGTPTITTGRQLGVIAFNPVWRISTLLQWGFNCNTLNSPQWHAPVGTTEPSRRHIMDRAWRGMVWHDGRYGSVYTYGYNNNVGMAYTMNEQEWQEWWWMQQRHSLLVPEAPIGAGLVMTSSVFADAQTARFTCGDPMEFECVRTFTRTFQLLHEAGVSLPFAANAGSLGKWTGNAPLVIVDLNSFNASELAALSALQARGVAMAAFADNDSLSPMARAIFSKPGATLLNRTAAGMTPREASVVASRLAACLTLGVSFGGGTSGYGFAMRDTKFIVVVTVRLKAGAGARRGTACLVSDHRALKPTLDRGTWVIEAPIRPGDGLLIAVREES
jgi:hypothetical protein